MNKWDSEENKDNVRYSVIVTETGIKIVDLATGRMDYSSWDGRTLKGSGQAKDFKNGFVRVSELLDQEREIVAELKDLEKKLPKDNFTSFFNANFSWKEICECELGIEYLK